MTRLRRIGLIAMVAMMLALVAAPVARAQVSPLDALGPAGLQDVLSQLRLCAAASREWQVAERDLCFLNVDQTPVYVFKGQAPKKRLTPEQLQKAAAVRKARAEAAKAEADRLLQEKIEAAVAARVEPLQRRVAQLEAEARAAAQRELTANALTRQALEQNRALAEDRDEKLARPMWLVVGILSIMLGMAVALVFMRGSGRRGGDDPPQGPRGPDGGERKLTHEGLRADEVRKPTTEELPIFSIPQSGEPELPHQQAATSIESEQPEASVIRDLSPDELAAIARPRVSASSEDDTGEDTVALTMATGPILQAEKLEEGVSNDGEEPSVVRTSRSLAGRSLTQTILPYDLRQPIHEQIYNLLVEAEKRKDEEAVGELKRLIADASSASSREEIASVKARLVVMQERSK